MKGIKRKIKVDGVLCRTVTEAALKVGCTPMAIVAALKQGRQTIKGHHIEESQDVDDVLEEIRRSNSEPYVFTNGRRDAT